MSRHNYTNPAFCQDETYARPPSAQTTPTIVETSPARVHRSESFRSFHSAASTNRSLRNGIQRMNSGLNLNCSHHHHQMHQPLSLPPRPGPKGIVSSPKVPPFPGGSRYGSISDVQNQSISGRYALVPVEELNKSSEGRYAVLPSSQSTSRYAKSQENLDHFGALEELPYNFSDQFLSLPSNSSPNKENGMLPAFSTDFGSKSFILFDQKNQQRYAVVPTEENEEIVDDNHEIIQMHNGKAHRYAVIPTDEEETCLNGDFERPTPPANYAIAMNRRASPQRTPQKQLIQRKVGDQLPSLPSTPKKNVLATQKLHELLTTPQKQSPLVRQHSTPLTPTNSPYRVHASYPKPSACTSRQNNDFSPQRLQYDQKMRMPSTTTLNMEQRTTAVIQPRLHSAASIYDETTTTNTEMTEKSWNKHLEMHKRSIATIGIISLMLMFCGIINSGLCIYMTSMSSIAALYVSHLLGSSHCYFRN